MSRCLEFYCRETRVDHSLESMRTAVRVICCAITKIPNYIKTNTLQSSRTTFIWHPNHKIDNLKVGSFTSFWAQENFVISGIFKTMI